VVTRIPVASATHATEVSRRPIRSTPNPTTVPTTSKTMAMGKGRVRLPSLRWSLSLTRLMASASGASPSGELAFASRRRPCQGPVRYVPASSASSISEIVADSSVTLLALPPYSSARVA
jgi:hypothetical protein